MPKKKKLLNSYKVGDELHINIPKGVSENDLSFVITRVLYFMVQQFAEDNHITFDKALSLYKEAIATDVGMQYDMEHKEEKKNV